MKSEKFLATGSGRHLDQAYISLIEDEGMNSLVIKLGHGQCLSVLLMDIASLSSD